MITLINPPGIKTLSGLQMHTPVDRFYTRRRRRKPAETAHR